MGRWGDDDLPTAYFAEALVELLESKPLSAISVSELTQRAGVSRVTFYRNYDSIEEVLERHVASIAHGYEKKASEGRGFASYIREDNILLLADTFREHANLVRCLRKRHAESYLFEAIERGTLAVSLASERASAACRRRSLRLPTAAPLPVRSYPGSWTGWGRTRARSPRCSAASSRSMRRY